MSNKDKTDNKDVEESVVEANLTQDIDSNEVKEGSVEENLEETKQDIPEYSEPEVMEENQKDSEDINETVPPAEKGEQTVSRKTPFYLSLKFIISFILIVGIALVGFYVNQLNVKQSEKLVALQSEFDKKLQSLDSKYNYQQAIESLTANNKKLAQDIKNIAVVDNSQLQTQLNQQKTEIEALRQQLINAATQLNRSEQFKTIEWQLAEIKYLLRIAQQRIVMEQDVTGAIAILESVDLIINNTQDISLFNIRDIVAKDKVALESVSNIDIEGVYIQINNIRNQVEQFDYIVEKLKKEVTEKSFMEIFWGSFSVRDISEEYIGQLDPVHHNIAKQSLVLMLEQMQSAILNNQQDIFNLSLVKSKKQLAQYFSNESQFEWIDEQLNQLQAVSLSQDLPDVLNSIQALDQYLLNLSE